MTFDLVSAARDPGCFAASLVYHVEEWGHVINDLISIVAAQQTKHENLQSRNEQLSEGYREFQTDGSMERHLAYLNHRKSRTRIRDFSSPRQR